MLAELEPWIATLCMNKFGCRVLQTVSFITFYFYVNALDIHEMNRLLQILTLGGPQAQKTITESMTREIVEICNNEHGNHVREVAFLQLRVT